MKSLIYEILIGFQENLIGPMSRRLGKKLYEVGTKIQGEYASQDRLVPSLRKLSYAGKTPQISDAEFIAPNSTIIGDIKLGNKSSVWYGATIVGTTPIRIGNNTVIQDRAYLSHHSKIGDNVIVGPNTVIQGSTIMNRAVVSMGSSIRNASVQMGGFVAAGAVIPENAVVKEGEIWAGNPAKFLRNVTPLQREILHESLEELQDLACIHSQQTEKDWRELINQTEEQEITHDFEQYIKNLGKYLVRFSESDEEFAETRVFVREKILAPQPGQYYEPYDHQIQNLGQKFKLGVHSETLKKVATKVQKKERFQSDKSPWHAAF